QALQGTCNSTDFFEAALDLHNLKVILEEYPGLQGGWNGLVLKEQNHEDCLYSIDTCTALSAIMSVLLYNPVQCRGLGSHPPEAHIKIQKWSKYQLIPGNAKEGSSRSEFSAVILNSKQWQFPFFIVEFEQHGFEVHKDVAVVRENDCDQININNSKMVFIFGKLCAEIKDFLEKSATQYNQSILKAMPKLPRQQKNFEKRSLR
ncbi:3175_t:CDS:2, partial [Acaulospora morrowiae]